MSRCENWQKRKGKYSSFCHLFSFSLQSLYIKSQPERKERDQFGYDVIKKNPLWHCYFWLLEISGFMNFHCSALNRQQRQLHSVFNPVIKNVLHSQCAFISYFLAEVPSPAPEIPGCLTTIAERLCGPECSTREEGCQPAVSEGWRVYDSIQREPKTRWSPAPDLSADVGGSMHLFIM